MCIVSVYNHQVIGFYVSSVALIVNYSCNIAIQIYNSNADLRKFYKVLTTSSDGINEFVSTMEGKAHSLF